MYKHAYTMGFDHAMQKIAGGLVANPKYLKAGLKAVDGKSIRQGGTAMGKKMARDIEEELTLDDGISALKKSKSYLDEVPKAPVIPTKSYMEIQKEKAMGAFGHQSKTPDDVVRPVNWG